MKRAKPFAMETDLCAHFIAAIKDDWTAYAETGGWDILLVRKADGFQIGVQAKMRLNSDVISQAIEDGYCFYAERSGPDCRAVLVPSVDAGSFDKIAGYIGLTIIRAYAPSGYASFRPQLPRINDRREDWFEWAPSKRHALPEYVPDVAAGASAPLQLTSWKIAAIKIAVTLEKRGFLTRADFRHHGIDHRRWLSAGGGWLRLVGGRYVAGHRMPDFRAAHPRVYEEVAADADKWMPQSPLAPCDGSPEGRDRNGLGAKPDSAATRSGGRQINSDIPKFGIP